MKFPLYLKLLLSLLANLALIAGVLLAGSVGSGAGWSLLLSAPVRDRLVIIAQDFTTDFSQATSDARMTVVDKYHRQYGVDFILRMPDEGPGPRNGAGGPGPRAMEPAQGPPRDGMNGPHGAGFPGEGMRGPPPFGGPGERALLPPDELGPPPMRERAQRVSNIGLRHLRGGGYELMVPATINENTPRARGREVAVHATSLSALVGFLGIAEGVRLLIILLLLSALIWAPLLIGITRTLMRITETTERIAEGRFDARLHTRRTDEIGTLANAINRMAERLESFVARQRTFMADVAHEVTSPLARMRIGLGLLEGALDDKQKLILQDIEEDAEQMSQMLNELLMFSRAGLEAGLGSGASAPEQVNLSAMVRDAIAQEDAAPRAQLEIAAELSVSGYRALLTRAVANLVRNALRYAAPESGPVELSARALKETVQLIVRDRGPGVPEAVLENLGQPFFRPEVARSRDTGGFGLGLAIVRRCIESCGGSVSFGNRSGGGFEAVITLKLTA